MKYTEQGWHIEYDPSITEEMFNEFVKTLSNDGWKQEEHVSCGLKYKDFVNHGFIGCRSDGGHFAWCIDNNENSRFIKKKMSDFISITPGSPEEYIKGEYYVTNCESKDDKRELYVIEYVQKRPNAYHEGNYYPIGNSSSIYIGGYFTNIIRKATEEEKKPFLEKRLTSGSTISPTEKLEIGDEVEIVSLHNSSGKVGDQPYYSGIIGHRGVISNIYDNGNYCNISLEPSCRGSVWNASHLKLIRKKAKASSKPSEPSPKQPELIDSWCVKVTEENREIVKKHVDSGGLYSIGSYYGVEKLGNSGGYQKNWSDYFNKLLTTEEFYQKVGHVPSSLPFKFGELAYVYKDGFGCGIGDLGVHILYDKTKVGSAKYSGYESRIYAIWCPKENVYKCIDTSVIRAATSQEIAQYKYPDAKESAAEFSPSGKFKIGDIIIGNSKASRTYNITIEGWKGIITSFSLKGLVVRGLESDATFNDLKEDCFDLYQRDGLTMASISEFDAQIIEKAVAGWSNPPYNLDLSYDKNPTILKKSKKPRLITCDF